VFNPSAKWAESKAQPVFGFVMKIEGLSNYRGRNPHGYFQDLPWKVRQRAYAWLSRFLKRHPYCPSWRFAILVGQAKRLALMSDDELSAWGRSMHAKRGGYAVQRRYWHEGRIGPDHPAHAASQASAATAEIAKVRAAGAAAKPGVWHLPIGSGNLQVGIMRHIENPERYVKGALSSQPKFEHKAGCPGKRLD